MPEFLKSEALSGKREGLRSPCRFQLLCLLDAWPTASSLPPSVFAGSCLSGQLDVFSSWWWMGFSDCFLDPKDDLHVCVSYLS